MTSSTCSKLPEQIISSKAYQFACDVVDGKIVSGKRRILAAKRFLTDLGRMDDPDFPWTFDIEKAYRPIEFIERFLVPTKGNYSKMTLLPWQHFVEANMYGWVSKKTNLRRFREALIIVGSGNGKSTMVTGNAAYGLSKDGERGAEIYCLANSKKQARIVFDECKTQVFASPILTKHFRVTRNGMYHEKTNSKFEPLATDSSNLQGLNVHMAIFDEVQDYRDYRLINAIKAKGKKRQQPMIIYITTLGTVVDGPLMDYYILGSSILDGTSAIAQRAADRMFVYIDEIDEGDDPNDISCWGKANPSLGVLLKLDDLIDEWERNKAVPQERADFINKQLNVFTLVDELSFIDNETLNKNNKIIDLESLEGRICYGGFDLSETEDFTAACLEFPLDDGRYFVLEHSWVPVKKVKIDREKLDWRGLEAEGVLTIVQSPFVEYEDVLEWFLKKRKLYRIESVGFDPAKAFRIVNEMRSEGFAMNIVRQGELTLTAPLDDLKELFLAGKIVHNNNRMFKWYVRNVKLTKRGPNATYLPTKQNKYRKIDGFASLLSSHVEIMNSTGRAIKKDARVASVISLDE